MLEETLKVMTFNVRFDAASDAPDHTWANRKNAAVAVIRSRTPDVVGLQEVQPHQRADLVEGLAGYEIIGTGRDAGGGGESVPVLFDAERFALTAGGDFWLSDAPDAEGSIGWDADAPRICTWAVLTECSSDCAFAVLNTHLDRWGARARIEGARLIVGKVAELAPTPCIVTGDFNCGEEDEPFIVFADAGFRDSYRDVSDEPPPVTIHHYDLERAKRRAASGKSPKIDYVLCGDRWRVLGAEVVRDKPFGRWPSDHYPVTAELELVSP